MYAYTGKTLPNCRQQHDDGAFVWQTFTDDALLKTSLNEVFLFLVAN